MKKNKKEDWFIQGMLILSKDGFSKITIDNLCSILKVTKGSFYHHFGNIDGFIKALMEYWLEIHTLSFIKESEKIENILIRRDHLQMKSIGAEYKNEQAIRAWGYSNPIVREYVQRVDQTRLNYLIDLRIKSGESYKTARYMAMLEYATLVGIQQLYPDLDKDELTEMYTNKSVK